MQAVREAARRAQCVNNLKQIGLALHNYHDAKASSPRAHHGGRSRSTGGWALAEQVPELAGLILPHLEQSPLYNAINFSVRRQQLGRRRGRVRRPG